MIRFLWFIYIELLIFYIELNSIGTKNKKLTLDETHGIKLNFN